MPLRSGKASYAELLDAEAVSVMSLSGATFAGLSKRVYTQPASFAWTLAAATEPEASVPPPDFSMLRISGAPLPPSRCTRSQTPWIVVVLLPVRMSWRTPASPPIGLGSHTSM